MSPLIIAVLAQVLDVAIGAITKHPEWEPHLGPLIATSMTSLSQAVGETPQQTADRRAAAEAIFAKYAQPIVAPTPGG